MTQLNVNGRQVTVDADPSTPLLWALRDHLGLTGTKYSCGVAVCGACTVHVNGQPVRACTTPVAAVAGAQITTIEAVEADRIGRAVQESWIRNDVVQCGFCQSGPCVPTLLSIFFIPYFLYKVFPPEIKATPQASEMAHRELEKVGPWKRTEKTMLIVFLLILVLWATSEWNKLDATLVALIGIGVMLVTKVITWDDILAEKGAWDALIWFGGLVTMAGQLNTLGLIKWFATVMGGVVSGWAWLPALIVLLLVYVYAHYAFASTTAHVTAMYPPYLAIMIGAGAPPYLAAMSLAFFSGIMNGITHYNFFELAVAAAISLFGFESGAALATVVGVLIEVPLMLLVVRWVNASRDRYERGARA